MGWAAATAAAAAGSVAAAVGVRHRRNTSLAEMEGDPAAMPVYRQADVVAHDSMEKGVWVTYMGKVYDISESRFLLSTRLPTIPLQDTTQE
jgi:cytochrome b involved in lipid metabolism